MRRSIVRFLLSYLLVVICLLSLTVPVLASESNQMLRSGYQSGSFVLNGVPYSYTATISCSNTNGGYTRFITDAYVTRLHLPVYLEYTSMSDGEHTITSLTERHVSQSGTSNSSYTYLHSGHTLKSYQLVKGTIYVYVIQSNGSQNTYVFNLKMPD